MATQVLASSNHAVYRLFLHLVVVTKYRRKVLTAPMIDRCREILRDTAVRWGCQVVESEGEADHVHALLEVAPKVRPSDLVNNLKTVTSRRLRSEFPGLQEAYRRKPVLWSRSYCLVSAGGAPLEVLRAYIQNQERPA
jgi:putative transposase